MAQWVLEDAVGDAVLVHGLVPHELPGLLFLDVHVLGEGVHVPVQGHASALVPAVANGVFRKMCYKA
jgi:hypothetical protein